MPELTFSHSYTSRFLANFIKHGVYFVVSNFFPHQLGNITFKINVLFFFHNNNQQLYKVVHHVQIHYGKTANNHNSKNFIVYRSRWGQFI